ncbi:MAG: hypothetical protein JNJ77_15120 [Planctomycetia bacterium]|nr:hypothetical protein [Planctomycetia bacterium]
MFPGTPTANGQQAELSVEKRVEQLEKQLKELKESQPQAPSSALPDLFAEIKAPPAFPTWKLNGSMNADAGWYNQTDGNRAQVGELQDGASFRRARLGVSGNVRENISYFLQMDFAFPGRPTFTDVFLNIDDVPGLGHVRFGQWKHPYSLEIVTSFRHNPWLERSPVFLLSPFRHIGLGFYDYSENEQNTWAVSVIKPGNDQYGGDLGDLGGIGVVGRLTSSPVYDSEGEQVWHIGTAFYIADPGSNLFRIGAFGGNAPEFALNINSTIQPSMVDTDFIPTNWYNSVQGETALVWGPLSIQAEGAYSYLSQISQSPLHFYAGYVGASYFLTGEHRNYVRKTGAFGPIKVNNEYNPMKNGLAFGGAWELTARLSYIDATDENIDGGVLTDATAGVNWWLNTHTRLTFNYIHAWLDKEPTGQTEASIFAIRAQVDF